MKVWFSLAQNVSYYKNPNMNFPVKLWGGGRVVMALCLGSFEQIRSSKERGFDPRPPQLNFCHEGLTF